MTKAIALGPNIFRIPTLGDFINTFVLVNEDGSVTLIDCGVKKAPKRIVDGLASIGKHPADVTRIVLTHAHGDHAGGAAEMVTTTGIDGVTVHEEDAQYVVSGSGSPVDKTLRLGRIFYRMPHGFAPTPVSDRLVDDQLLDIAGGLRIHHTPGHSPGHVSLVHEPSSVMITGDAIWNMASRMTWPVSGFCQSYMMNRQTAHVLGELEYDTVAFTHGPHITENARESIRGFLKRKGQ